MEKHLLLGSSDPNASSRAPGSGRAAKLRKRSGFLTPLLKEESPVKVAAAK